MHDRGCGTVVKKPTERKIGVNKHRMGAVIIHKEGMRTVGINDRGTIGAIVEQGIGAVSIRNGSLGGCRGRTAGDKKQK